MKRTFPFTFFGILLGATLCCCSLKLDAQNAPDNEVQKVLSWLPPDTETLTVADSRKRSFLSPEMFRKRNPEEGRADADPPASIHDIGERFQVLPLLFLGIKDGFLSELFENHPLALAVEGSRHFRGTSGLGLMPFEGCEIMVFRNDVRADGESLLSRQRGTAIRTDELEGKIVTVFEEERDDDTWTFYVIVPLPNVLLVCSNRNYAKEVLHRIQKSAPNRALAESLPEWKYANTGAPFWGLRHFDRSQAELDPTSPFGGKHNGNSPDQQAIGLAFSFDPDRSNAVTIVYLSSDPHIKGKLRGYEPSPDYESGSDLRVSSGELKPGIIQYSYSFSTLSALKEFFFGFWAILGHGIDL